MTPPFYLEMVEMKPTIKGAGRPEAILEPQDLDTKKSRAHF